MDSNVSKYVTQQVMTATPAKLVFLLYEKAITSLHEACNAIDKKEVEVRWKANNRAIEIVSQLPCGGNRSKGASGAPMHQPMRSRKTAASLAADRIPDTISFLML